jgi:hypothetical protein
VDLSDQDLVLQLIARDGRRRRISHTEISPCRYAEIYGEGNCPWCEVERRRRGERLDQNAPATLTTSAGS